MELLTNFNEVFFACDKFFFCTAAPESLRISCAWYEKTLLNQTGPEWMQYIPLFLYSIRWNIKVSYYEQKTFWSLCAYMLRSRKGIENFLNHSELVKK